MQGHEDRTGRVHRGVVPGLRRPDPHRRPITVAGQRHRAARRGDGQVGGGPGRLGTGLAERRDGRGHQRRVRAAQRVEVDVEHAARDHCVAVGRELGNLGWFLDDHRVLASVADPELDSALRIDDIVDVRAPVPGSVPVGRLAEHHLGAELGEQQAGEVAPVVGQIQYPVPVQHVSALLSRRSSAGQRQSADAASPCARLHHLRRGARWRLEGAEGALRVGVRRAADRRGRLGSPTAAGRRAARGCGARVAAGCR